MSYQKMMKWHSKHRRGTRQPVLMSTNSGFWASASWVENDFIPYLKECAENKIEPLTDEQFYLLTNFNHILQGMTLSNIIKYQKLMIIRAKRENKTLYNCILGG